MRINLPQCNLKNCRFNSDGNCLHKAEYGRCDHAHAIMMLERLIKDHGLCWLCQSYHAAKNENGRCEDGCIPSWNGLYFSKKWALVF